MSVEDVLDNTGYVDAYNACKRAVSRFHFPSGTYCPECNVAWPCRTWALFTDDLVARRPSKP